MNQSKNRLTKERWAPKKIDGKLFCKWCEKKEVMSPRAHYCSVGCREEYYIRRVPQFVRGKLLRRDMGICASCGIDAAKIDRVVEKIQSRMPHRWANEPDDKVQIKRLQGLLNRMNEKYRGVIGSRYFNEYNLKSYWQADHIVPVIEGGGECGLDNYRTLCTPCHKNATKALRKRMKKS